MLPDVSWESQPWMVHVSRLSRSMVEVLLIICFAKLRQSLSWRKWDRASLHAINSYQENKADKLACTVYRCSTVSLGSWIYIQRETAHAGCAGCQKWTSI